ncbi:MAG TPA: glycosyltransferase [Bryobacteraceae bacterium]|nr:glycosyltransferase [Bryobacteraceae bacterium]
MRFVIFTHSLVSDWNHGNAHFLRGIATELIDAGHDVRIFEPANGWSLSNLIADRGISAISEFARAYPRLRSRLYDEAELDPARVLRKADVAIVHEWNSPGLVRRIGQYRAANPHLRLYFHDTHHRSVTDADAMKCYDLRHYDGVLAYGCVIRDLYLGRGWAKNAWTWHEAADTRVFHPMPGAASEGDLVWIGNWGDGERSEEIREFLIEPVRALRLRARVYGVRYPAHAIEALKAAGIEYAGSLPNYRVPRIFSRFRVTVHIPRRPYVRALPGIPTIRPFEALACGIPLVSAPWSDSEHLFRPGTDFLFARDAREMTDSLRAVLEDPTMALGLAARGLETILDRHTCAHRAAELLSLVSSHSKVAVQGT